LVLTASLYSDPLHAMKRLDGDVDILVHFSPGAKTYARFLALGEMLEACLGRRVELITVEALSPF